MLIRDRDRDRERERHLRGEQKSKELMLALLPIIDGSFFSFSFSLRNQTPTGRRPEARWPRGATGAHRAQGEIGGEMERWREREKADRWSFVRRRKEKNHRAFPLFSFRPRPLPPEALVSPTPSDPQTRCSLTSRYRNPFPSFPPPLSLPP